MADSVYFDLSPQNITEPNFQSPKSVSIDSIDFESTFGIEPGYLSWGLTPENPIHNTSMHSFVDSWLYAYLYGTKLSITPNHIWSTILLSFAEYVDNNDQIKSQIYISPVPRRHSFTTDSVIKTTEQVILMTDTISNSLSGKIVPGICDWLWPKFSTTVESDVILAQSVLFHETKPKELFKTSPLKFCYNNTPKNHGIAGITILGTIHDWKLLLDKITYLYTFNNTDMKNWADILIPIIENFIDVYRNTIINTDFWSNAVRYIPSRAGDEISGWFISFIPFFNGVWMLSDIKNITKIAISEALISKKSTKYYRKEITLSTKLLSASPISPSPSPTNSTDIYFISTKDYNALKYGKIKIDTLVHSSYTTSIIDIFINNTIVPHLLHCGAFVNDFDSHNTIIRPTFVPILYSSVSS